jgi:hypothetical protein
MFYFETGAATRPRPPEVIAPIPEGLCDVTVIPGRLSFVTIVKSESHRRSGTSRTACVRLSIGRAATETGETEPVGMNTAIGPVPNMARQPADCRLKEWEKHHAR